MRPDSVSRNRGPARRSVARTRSGDLRKRVVILFVAGVALPSGLLGYLALRGVRNDQALFEREQREELQEAGLEVLASLQVRLAAMESAARTSADLALQDPLVSAVFDLTSQGELLELTSSGALYSVVAEGPTTSTGGMTRPDAVRLSEARRLELGAQDLLAAELEYAALLDQGESRRGQGEGLSGLARVSRKRGRVGEALQRYRRLIDEYGEAESGAGLPFAVVGRLESLSMLEEASDRGGAAAEAAALLDELLRAEHDLSRTEYVFAADRAREAARRLIPVMDVEERSTWVDSLGLLVAREGEARARSDRVGGFVETAASQPDALRALAERSRALGAQGAMVPGEGGPYPVYALPLDVSADDAGDLLRGLLLEASALDEAVQTVVRGVAATYDLRWVLRDEQGVAVAASDATSDAPLVSEAFPGRFPPLTLGLLPPAAGTVQSFFASPRSVYLYAFVLVIGILAGGLALTVRTLSHQLELARMQSDFVSTVSHELKSPLTSIRQLSEMLQAGRVSSAKRRQRYFDVLVEQSERLTLLIDHVLDFARMDSGRTELDLVEVDLRSLLQELVSGFQERVRHQGFVIRDEIDASLPLVMVDPAAIELAATNVIDNGIKFSGDSREVVVRAMTENGDAVIAVQDFGIGLRPSERGRVFERFYRGGEALTRSVKGTGLGLTLVKQIVEAHGGSVAAESVPGEGTTFTLRIPVKGP